MVDCSPLGGEGLWREEIALSFLLGEFVGAVNELKDTAAMIIEQHNAQIGWQVLMPKGVAVIEEGQIACNEGRDLIGGQSGSDGGAHGAINPARAAIGVDAIELHVGQVADVVHVANNGAVADLQAAVSRQMLHDAIDGLELAKGDFI